MRSILRSAVLGAALLGVTAGVAEAQSKFKVEEIRLELASFTTVSDGYTDLTLSAPGSVALGIYINDNIALEPMVVINNFKPDGGDATNTLGFGVMVPYYLSGDRGHNSFFIAPGFLWMKVGDNDAGTDIGADIGIKKALNSKVSWRAAASLRTGDSTGDELAIGANFGFSIWWR